MNCAWIPQVESLLLLLLLLLLCSSSFASFLSVSWRIKHDLHIDSTDGVFSSSSPPPPPPVFICFSKFLVCLSWRNKDKLCM